MNPTPIDQPPDLARLELFLLDFTRAAFAAAAILGALFLLGAVHGLIHRI